MGTLIVKKIPDDVKLLFKLMCVEKGTTIREEIIHLMKEAGNTYRKNEVRKWNSRDQKR